jgi:2-dehydro-3-deoxyphosphooctonate aldolase (KDO 8-P synthase)
MSKTWILGSCSIETEELYNNIAKELIPLMNGEDWFYKASFDKANRSSIDGKRGPGLEESIGIFERFKKDNPQIRITTDLHEVWQVEKLAGLIDCIQIPAFLCRQTDLLVECAKNFPIVNIKKGQWMSPQNMVKGVDKIKNVNPNAEAWITERGTQFGYSQLIVDFGAVDVLKEHYDKVILDCTHSTQRLKPNGRTGGDHKLAERYFKVADIFGYDGIFAETHPNPIEAYSDGDSQIPLTKMKKLLKNE